MSVSSLLFVLVLLLSLSYVSHFCNYIRGATLNYDSRQFYTTLNDLWADTEQIWEGVFSVIAAGIIYVCSVPTSQLLLILTHFLSPR